MNKALLLSFIFLVCLGSAFALTGNTSDYYVHGDIVNAGDKNETFEHDVYWVITEQPTIIKGYWDGQFAYVGFFPIQDDYTYYVPFENGTFTYHCNPDSTEIGDNIICTGQLTSGDGTAILGAKIDWGLYDYNNTLYDSGSFIEIGNGVYKFNVNTDPNQNYTEGDYYFIFNSEGFKTDYSFPVYLSTTIQNFGLAIALGLIVLTYAILTTRISGALPHLQSMFLIFAELMTLISLRVFNEMTGYTEFLSGYKIMLWVLVLTLIFLFIELFISIFLPLIRKKWGR